MYKEIALDPECMGDYEYYSLVRQNFGFENGRYISAEVKSWARQAYPFVKNSGMKPMRRSAVQNFLNSLMKKKQSDEFALASDRKSISEDNWDNWVSLQRTMREFSCIVTNKSGPDNISVEEINNGCEVWKVPASISVTKSPESIVTSLLPLLVISNHLTIIDPYFLLSGNPVLIELFAAIQISGVSSLTVVTSLITRNAESIYDAEYKNLNVRNINFKWIKAPDKFFHDRYLISEHGAVRSGNGFMAAGEKGAQSDLANLNIISKEEALRTLLALESALESGNARVEFETG